MDHVCTSNGFGFCAECRAQGRREGSPVGSAVKALRTVRAYRASLAACESDASRLGLTTVAGSVAKLRNAPGTVAALSRKLSVYQGETVRAADGARNRAAKAATKAAKASAAQIAANAARIAKVVSQDATYRVYVRFAGGAHDVIACPMGDQPNGYRETRVSAKVRGDRPGLRFGDTRNRAGWVLEQGAESLAASIRAKLDKTSNARTFRVNRRRRG